MILYRFMTNIAVEALVIRLIAYQDPRTAALLQSEVQMTVQAPLAAEASRQVRLVTVRPAIHAAQTHANS